MSWLACEPAARLGESRKRLDELRVAAGGLRSTVRIFEACLPKAWGRLRRRLKSMQRLITTVQQLGLALDELAAARVQACVASETTLSATAFLLGVHFEQLRVKGGNLRHRASKLIAKAQGRRWKALHKSMARFSEAVADGAAR
jgi:CHAD domain-containing protein